MTTIRFLQVTLRFPVYHLEDCHAYFVTIHMRDRLDYTQHS